MDKTYKFPMPFAEACYQARTWEMRPEEVSLFAKLLGGDGCYGAWYFDTFPMLDDCDWWASRLDEDGKLEVYCPTMQSDVYTREEQAGHWIDVHKTDFAERFKTKENAT